MAERSTIDTKRDIKLNKWSKKEMQRTPTRTAFAIIMIMPDAWLETAIYILCRTTHQQGCIIYLKVIVQSRIQMMGTALKY